MNCKTLEWKNKELILIDQTKLPNEVEFVTLNTLQGVFDSIKDMMKTEYGQYLRKLVEEKP